MITTTTFADVRAGDFIVIPGSPVALVESIATDDDGRLVRVIVRLRCQADSPVEVISIER